MNLVLIFSFLTKKLVNILGTNAGSQMSWFWSKCVLSSSSSAVLASADCAGPQLASLTLFLTERTFPVSVMIQYWCHFLPGILSLGHDFSTLVLLKHWARSSFVIVDYLGYWSSILDICLQDSRDILSHHANWHVSENGQIFAGGQLLSSTGNAAYTF